MTRPVITPTRIDPATDRNFTILQQILCGGISLDNMNIRVVEGTTANTPDSAGNLIHSMSPHPISWWPLVGDVYVQKIDEKYIDVRSTKPAVNYKIILIAGTPVTSETVAAVGGDAYQDTVELIQEPNGPVIVNPEDVPGTTTSILPYTTFVAQQPSTSYNSIIKIEDYFYVAPQSSVGVIYRIAAISGEATSLSIGGTEALSAFYFDGSNLWCSQVMLNNSGTLTHNVYTIDLPTFSVASTLTCTANGPFPNALADISTLYIDGSRVYCGGCTTQGSKPGKMIVYNRSTGAQITSYGFSAATWGTLSNGGIRSINVNTRGTEMYLTTLDCASLSQIRIGVVDLAAGTMTTYTNAVNLRVTGGAAVYYNNSIWMPVQPISALSNSGVVVANHYRVFLLEFNTITHTFTEHPVPIGINLASIDLNSYFIRNCIEIDGYIYMVVANSNQASIIIEYDVLNDSFSNFVCPVIHDQYQHSAVPANLNTVLVKDDSIDAGFVIVRQILSSSVGISTNFEWFEPDFSE